MMAGGYDLDEDNNLKKDGGWNTHAAVCHTHKDFDLVAFVDPSEEKRNLFGKVWGVDNVFADVETALNSDIDFNIAIVSSPTQSHAHVLEALLCSSVQGVLCEKPLTQCADEAQELVSAYERKNIPLAVNFTRRWNPYIIELKQGIADNIWGQSVGFSGCYTGGFLHNGSHMVDLLIYLFGAVESSSIHNFSFQGLDDGDIDLTLKTLNGPQGFMKSRDQTQFSVFELELWFERSVVALKDWGRVVEVREATPSRLVPGRLDLASPTVRPTGWELALKGALENVRDAIREDVPLLSSGQTAMASQTFCEAIYFKGKLEMELD